MRNKKGYLLGMFTGMVGLVVVYAAVGLLYPGFLKGGSASTNTPPKAAAPTPVPYSAGKKIDEILSALDQYYVEQIDMEELTDKIFREVVGILEDPYTTYMNAVQYKDFLEDTEGIYAGIGVSVSVDLEKDQIIVVVPFEGYPGAKSGLLPGDAIVKVNGYDVKGSMLQEAVSMMKGEPGTGVDVTIYRESTNETFEVHIVREIINVPTVNHKMLENNIGYLRITQFERVTYDQFMKAYADLNSKGMKGLILDLRSNPGGLLSIVNQITDVLVPEGTIVYTEDKHGRKVYTPSNPAHIELPLLILVNGGSASASEVLSGAVRDHGVGELVGTTTFGKGLVQNLYTLPDKSAIKITIAKYYTPNGICIQGTGLEPDYEIDMDNELTVRISSLTLDEDIQLKRAVEIMLGKIK